MRDAVGPYRVQSVLGRGGMGIVYRGVHANLSRDVAIKALAPELTRDPQFRQRFFSEARSQAMLQHPNIVTIYDLLEDGDEYFIIMEFVDGQGLDDMLAQRPGQGLAQTEALQIFSQILSALDHAHSQGVVHRDVKSSNVLVGSQGRVKLMDFGIAILIGDKRLTQSSQTIGTPVYMSPEQILRPREVDHRTDIYSAGVLLYEMLAGRPPFDAETEYEIKKHHIETVPAEIGSLVPQLPREASGVLARALDKKPEDRFSSAGEFLRALHGAFPQAFAGTATPPPVPEPTRASTAPPSSVQATVPTHVPPGPAKRWPSLGVLSAAAVLVVALAISGAFLLGTDGDEGGDEDAVASVAPPAAPTASPPQPEPLPAAEVALPAPARTASVEAEPKATVPPSSSSDSRSSGQTRRPPPEEPPKPPPKPRPTRDVEAEIQRKTVAELRRKITTGIRDVESQIGRKNFEAAQRQVKELIGLSARFRGEMVDEVVRLRLLEEQITDAIVAERMRENEVVAQRAALERRLSEIQDLVTNKQYPEAKSLANGLLAESSLPEDIAQSARALVEQADQGLKNIFKGTQWEEEETEVQNETKKDRRKREKEENSDGG